MITHLVCLDIKYKIHCEFRKDTRYKKHVSLIHQIHGTFILPIEFY